MGRVLLVHPDRKGSARTVTVFLKLWEQTYELNDQSIKKKTAGLEGRASCLFVSDGNNENCDQVI
ncbi:hypothetical protein ACFQWC_13340 [Rossellomorea sp. GCM10028870]|uniref:hypothetical protein n=1 Tax=unclassified Rossellomorea TaxID=2837526 RepID=UPI0030E025DE